jgi:peptide/nickel transport system permease protein
MKYLFYRFSQMLAIIAFLSVALFALLSAMPGNPVDMLIMSNPRVKPEDVIRLKKLRGLDRPWYIQYVRWIWGYNDPFRAATMKKIESIIVVTDKENRAIASIDLSDAVFNSNYRLKKDEIIKIIQADRPQIWQKIEANSDIQTASSNEVVDVMLELIATEDEVYYQNLQKKMHQKSLQELTVRGLFGATNKGLIVTQTFETPGFHQIWFVIKNQVGLETVGSATVTVESASQKLVKNTFVVNSIPSQVVDDPKFFKVDLASYLDQGNNNSEEYHYELLEGSPGTIDHNGIYTNIFEGTGQTAILFSVTNKDGVVAKAAFSVEKAPIPDPARFNKGFLFVFAGNKNALGFSNTYKRPVWELLAGTTSVCGDGKIDPGESCDDKSPTCSKFCQTVGLSLWARIKNIVTGMLVSSGRIGNTLQLMIPAILLSLIIALPLGILSAYRQYSWLDYIVNFFAFIGISLPVFWFAIMVMYLFAENLQWLPAGGVQTPSIQDEGLFVVLSDRLTHAILPTLVLSIAYIGRWLRYIRASMLEILPADYIRTARAKGLSEKVVILKHALRNALIPIVTILALSIPALFGGAVLTETVFSWPGIGRLEYDAIASSDYYVAIVVFLISAILVMLGNLLADLLYVIVDPRIRHG